KYINERNVSEITWRRGTSLILSCFRQADTYAERIVEDKCDVDALRAAQRDVRSPGSRRVRPKCGGRGDGANLPNARAALDSDGDGYLQLVFGRRTPRHSALFNIGVGLMLPGSRDTNTERNSRSHWSPSSVRSPVFLHMYSTGQRGVKVDGPRPVVRSGGGELLV
ncbi:hypothetical protein QR685DRAFT_453279, partial [Neurospora intermedia]